MHKSSEIRRGLASAIVLSLVTSTLAPLASAQTASSGSEGATKTEPDEQDPAPPSKAEPAEPEKPASPETPTRRDSTANQPKTTSQQPPREEEEAQQGDASPQGGQEVDGKETPNTQPPGGAEKGSPTEGTETAQPDAPSQEEREAARAAFEAGMEAFQAEEFQTAVQQFEKAQEVIPSPYAEYWIALSLDSADPDDEAPRATVEAYERFVSNPGAKHVGRDKIDQSVARIKELRKLLPATLKVVTDPAGATVLINGKKQGVAPLSVERPAGTYSVEARLEGYEPLSAEVELEGGITLEQQMNLVKTPPPPPPQAKESQPQPAPPANMTPAYVTLGIAGASLATTATFGIMALVAKNEFRDTPTRELADRAERNALISDMALGITITLGVTGVVLLTSGPQKAAQAVEAAGRPPQAGDLQVAPYAGLTGGGARARLTF